MKKWWGAWIILTFFIAGCTQQTKQDQVVVVAAASSLMNITEQLKEPFAAAHPGWRLEFVYNSSTKLATQIRQGADVDVFLSAHYESLDQLRFDGLIDYTITPFAYNRLVLAGSDQLGKDQDPLYFLRHYSGQIVMGEPLSVPAGHYAEQWLEEVGLLEEYQQRMIFSKDSRQVLTYLESGNTDVGIMYYSEAALSDKLAWYTLLPPLHDEIGYFSSVTKTSDVSEQAQTFIELLLEEKGQQLLKEYGFLTTAEELID